MENRQLFKPGHNACAGCGQAIAARVVVEASGPNTIVANNTGCLEVFSTTYPESAWGVPWIHSLFENCAAVASGVEAALKYLGKKEGINVIAQAGDGGTADIGLQALSGMWERGHDVLYVCLPPETELILGDGTITEIGEFVDTFIERNKLETRKLFLRCTEVIEEKLSLESGGNTSSNLTIPVTENTIENFKTVEIAPARGRVLSWDRNRFLPANVICAQRKTSDETLVKITTASGQKLRLTKEHKVLIDTIDGPKWQRAGLLKARVEVYAPRRITLDIQKNEFHILDFIDSGIKVRLSREEKQNINQKLKEKYGCVKDAAGIIGFKYWQFKEKARMVDLEGLIRIAKEIPSLEWEALRAHLTEFGVQGGRAVKTKVNTFTGDHMYLLGLISSDGSVDAEEYAVTFVNKEKQLVKCFKESYFKLFSGRKISELKNEEEVIYLKVSNPILSLLAKRLNIKSDPKELIKFPKELIASFLRGFFDGDGYCGIVKTSHSQDARIILSTIEEKLAKRLRQMLQRLGIACFQVSRPDRFDLVISSRGDIEKFFNEVSSNHPKQKKSMQRIKELWETREERGKLFSLAPKICGKILKEICKKQNVVLARLDKKRNICSLAAGVRRATKYRIQKYKEDLINIIGEEKKDLFEELDLYLKDDFYLDPIEKVEIIPCKSKFVYDITVENTHLFIPEGAFVVSNCYDNEAYMNTGVQRSGLTPFDTNTTTSPIGAKSTGNIRPKKPMPEIALAHGIPYVAVASAGFVQDLQRKVKKAFSIRGPKYIQVHVPCPLGWRHEINQTLDVAKLAVETGLYPLVEFENGALISVRKITPKPVEEYLKVQGRFKHLLNNPEEIKKIQEIADNNIKKYGLKQETQQAA